MGRSKKRKRGHDQQQRHVDGRILSLLYPSSRLCTLHDLLVALLLPSLQEYHAPSLKPAALSPPPSSLLAVKRASGSEVLLSTTRVYGTDVGLQHASLVGDIDIQQGTEAAVANPPHLHASQCTYACQSTSVNHVFSCKLAAASDATRQQAAPISEMEVTLSAAAHSLLVREGDPADYLSLLYQSYGVLPDSAPPIGSTVLEQRWSHQQVIDRVIQILFKQGRNSSNVLCFGFQQPRPRSSLEMEKTAPAGLACVTDNAAVRILNSQTWTRIHSRVGDLIMLHLLSHADIFHPLPHKCYVQVAGTSVLLLAQNSKKPWNGILSAEEGSTERRDASLEQGGLVGSNGRDSTKGNLHVSYSANSCTKSRSKERFNNVSAHDRNAPASKRKRPHSWQRRKMRRLKAARANEEGSHSVLEPNQVHLETDSQEFLVRATDLYHSRFLDVSEGGPATQGKFVSSSPFSQQRLFSDAATLIDDQPNDATEDIRQRISVQAVKCSPAKSRNGDAQEQGRKGENSGQRSGKFCKSGRYFVGIGAGRRFINRSRMYYRSKFPHHAGLPKSHLLQRLKPTYKDAVILFKAIFGKESLSMSNTCKERCLLCLKKCCKCICCLLKRLIFNARRCQFARFLKRHCSSCSISPLQKPQRKFLDKDVKPKVRLPRKMHAYQNEKHTAECSSEGAHQTHAQKGFVGSEEMLMEKGEHGFSSHSQVVAFVWAVCRRIVPEELLGSKKDWRILRRNVYDFVSLRRHESFSLAQGMFKLRLSAYSWYPEQCLCDCGLHKELGNSKSNQPLKRSLLESWIYWLFSGLIVPLIQAHFYVTESEKFKQNVLFYRKSVWAKIKATAVKEMVKCNFKKLSLQSALCLLKKGSLGFCRGRLLPKKVGTRLIANLGSPSAFPLDSALAKVATIGNVSKRRKKCENSSNSCAQTTSFPREIQRKSRSFKPINLILRDIHYCLKFEQENHEEDLGCSVFDYNDAYLKLLPYIIDRKRVSNASAPLYLVVCDAFKAFDTIKQDKLLEIVCEFVREEEYCVRRYGYASPNMKSVKVFYERSTSTIKGLTSMDSFLSTSEKQRNAVCIDLAYSVKLRRSNVLQVLKEHISRNILQIGQHYYLQVVGIPQGSILSSLLCSLYYGHFERSRLASTLHLNQSQSNEAKNLNNSCKAPSYLLTNAEGTGSLKTHSRAKLSRSSLVTGFAASINCVSSQTCGSGSQYMPSSSHKDPDKVLYAVTRKELVSRNIMLRLVDDWLFISNSPDDALEFVRRMHRGFSDYNCVANRLKTAVNFDAAIGGSAINMNIYRTQDGACFVRWSGVLINCNTLEVQADYTRYCGVNLRSTLTVWRRNNEGIFLMTKLCQFMRPKCHPIFYDGHINCPATVFLNAYQAFILCAMKFHAYNCSLPCRGKCKSRFGLKAILKCARYMHCLLAHRAHKISRRSQVKPLLLLQAKEARWLALRAFNKVLTRKQSRYTKLLSLIKSELLSPKYEGLSETPLMLSALDARRSSMFESIIY